MRIREEGIRDMMGVLDEGKRNLEHLHWACTISIP